MKRIVLWLALLLVTSPELTRSQPAFNTPTVGGGTGGGTVNQGTGSGVGNSWLGQLVDGATGSGSASSAAALFTLTAAQTQGSPSIVVNVTAVGSGTLGFQFSSDGGTTWNNDNCTVLGSNPPTILVSTTVVKQVACPNPTGYFRAMMTSYTSGTFTANYVLHSAAFGAPVVAVQGGAAGVAAPWYVDISPAASNGLTNARVNSAATTNATSQKAAGGLLYGYSLCNTGTAQAFFRFFNLATAPTVGTSTPTQTIALPIGGCVTWNSDIGVTYNTGIAYDITNLNGDSDTTAVAANQITGAFYYN